MTADYMRARAIAASKIVDDTISTLPSFEITTSANSLVALPLLYASMDNAASCVLLLRSNPGRSFVSVIALHRSQWEFLGRAAFFAHAASEKELTQFRKKGKMPKRSGRDIYLAEILEESFRVLGWDVRVADVLKNEKKRLNGFVHGGTEVVNAYVNNGEIGSLEFDLPLFTQVLNRVVAMCQLSMAVAMSMSSLPEERISDAVRPVYDQVRNFFGAPVP